MSLNIEDAEILASAHAPPLPGPPSEVTIVRTAHGLLCRYRVAGSLREEEEQVVAAPTVAMLENRVSHQLRRLAVQQPATADQLTRLNARAMEDASEKVRVARATTRREGESWWFDVALFRWGAHDFELACQFKGAPHRDPRVTGILGVLTGTTLSETLAAFELFCDALVLGRSSDEETPRKFRELREAGRAVAAEAMSLDARHPVA